MPLAFGSDGSVVEAALCVIGCFAPSMASTH